MDLSPAEILKCSYENCDSKCYRWVLGDFCTVHHLQKSVEIFGTTGRKVHEQEKILKAIDKELYNNEALRIKYLSLLVCIKCKNPCRIEQYGWWCDVCISKSFTGMCNLCPLSDECSDAFAEKERREILNNDRDLILKSVNIPTNEPNWIEIYGYCYNCIKNLSDIRFVNKWKIYKLALTSLASINNSN